MVTVTEIKGIWLPPSLTPPYNRLSFTKQLDSQFFAEVCMSMIGKTLGNFECTSLLGKGGMGEVYQSKDANRVARFQRETTLLASLNHPKIAAIHGLEESDGTHFLVMELVERVTLEDYIAGNAGVPAGKKLL